MEFEEYVAARSPALFRSAVLVIGPAALQLCLQVSLEGLEDEVGLATL